MHFEGRKRRQLRTKWERYHLRALSREMLFLPGPWSNLYFSSFFVGFWNVGRKELLVCIYLNWNWEWAEVCSRLVLDWERSVWKKSKINIDAWTGWTTDKYFTCLLNPLSLKELRWIFFRTDASKLTLLCFRATRSWGNPASPFARNFIGRKGVQDSAHQFSSVIFSFFGKWIGIAACHNDGQQKNQNQRQGKQFWMHGKRFRWRSVKIKLLHEWMVPEYLWWYSSVGQWRSEKARRLEEIREAWINWSKDVSLQRRFRS